MSLLKVAEFAKSIDQKPQSINTWGKRGKILIVNGLIDTDEPINRVFLAQKGFTKNESKQKEIKQPKRKEPKQEIEEKVIIKHNNNTEDAIDNISLLSKLKALKLKEDIKYVKLRNDEAEKKLINFERIQSVVFELYSNSRMEYFIAAENILINSIKDLGATNEQITRAKNDLVILFNKANKNAIENLKISIESI